MRGTFLAFILITVIVVTGCSEDSSSPADPMTLPALVVSPADAATGVRLDAPVKLTFNRPVDRALIERSFHLISESALLDSTCTDTTMTHTSMMNCMDETMMRHMELYHSTEGQYSWSESGTMCTFQPGSMLMPSARYMMHMDSEMAEEAGLHECCVDMMDGHGSGMMDGGMTLHFTTMASGGHEDHH